MIPGLKIEFMENTKNQILMANSLLMKVVIAIG